MSATHTQRPSKTDWARIDSIRDEDIDYSDIQSTDDDFWDKAELVMPRPKKAISLRVDQELLEYIPLEMFGSLDDLLNNYLHGVLADDND